MNQLQIRPGDKVQLNISDDPTIAYVTNWQFRQGGRVFLLVTPHESQRFAHGAGDWISGDCVDKVLEKGEIARALQIDSAVLV